MDDEPEERALATRAEASQHFRTNVSAMSYAELWAASKLAFPISVIMKLLREQGPLALLAPLSTSLQTLQWNALSERARQHLRAVVDDLEPRGFTEILLFAEDWRAFKLDCVSVALLDESKTTLLLAMYTCLYRHDGVPVGEHVDNVYYSFTDDGRVVMTRSSRYLMLQPPEYDVLHLDERPASEVATTHAERLAKMAIGGEPYRSAEPWTVLDPDALPDTVLALSRREAQFQVERGVYVPAGPEDLATLAASRQPATRTKPAHLLLVWVALTLVVLLIANLL